MIKKGFWKNHNLTNGYAACDNPNCPTRNDEAQNQTYQNGKVTLCSVCVEVEE